MVLIPYLSLFQGVYIPSNFCYLHKSNMAASWQDRKSVLDPLVTKWCILPLKWGFWGLQNPFLVLFCNFRAPIKIFYDCVKRYKDYCSWRKKFFHTLFINEISPMQKYIAIYKLLFGILHLFLCSIYINPRWLPDVMMKNEFRHRIMCNTLQIWFWGV